MVRRPRGYTRTDTLFSYTTLVGSEEVAEMVLLPRPAGRLADEQRRRRRLALRLSFPFGRVFRLAALAEAGHLGLGLALERRVEAGDEARHHADRQLDNGGRLRLPDADHAVAVNGAGTRRTEEHQS